MSMTVSRGVLPSTLLVHETGKNFEGTGLIVYTAKSKSWSNPSAYFDGTSERETTTDTGEKMVFTGWYVDTSGKRYRVRDTYASPSLNKLIGEGECQADSGAWKKFWAESCTKSEA